MRASGIPSVSKIPDRAMARGTEAISIPFFIMDDDTSFESIRVSVQTQNADLFPMGNISHTCNMGACSLTLMPAKNQMGRGRLVLVVQDGLNEVKAGFVVRVLDPDLPFVGPVGDMVGKVNQVIGPIAFMVDDMQTDPELLSLEVMSSNLSMVPVENIVVEGQGSERAVTITPLRDAYGMTEVTIAVSDGEGQTVLRSFRVDIPMPAGQKTSLPVSVRDAVPLGMPDPYSHLPEDHPVRQRMKR
ncbi:MAG TPA: hypothetical protein DCW68_00700 [Rhodospirillaceae bacterium]|nr:MAG: hypothetical protein A2018_00905 [Alphaproteobacteria bacterium GWF2_58_20]HAU28619.1 hypothetical protein [Rhodospirillaceae bacterium]